MPGGASWHIQPVVRYPRLRSTAAVASTMHPRTCLKYLFVVPLHWGKLFLRPITVQHRHALTLPLALTPRGVILRKCFPLYLAFFSKVAVAALQLSPPTRARSCERRICKCRQRTTRYVQKAPPWNGTRREPQPARVRVRTQVHRTVRYCAYMAPVSGQRDQQLFPFSLGWVLQQLLRAGLDVR